MNQISPRLHRIRIEPHLEGLRGVPADGAALGVRLVGRPAAAQVVGRVHHVEGGVDGHVGRTGAEALASLQRKRCSLCASLS